MRSIYFARFCRNPYDIARKDLLSQISKLRATLLRPNGAGGSLLKEGRTFIVFIARIYNCTIYTYCEQRKKKARASTDVNKWHSVVLHAILKMSQEG